jgi:ribosomal protein L24E
LQTSWFAAVRVIAGGSYGGQGLTVVKKDGTTFSFTLYGEEKQAYKVTR